MTVDVQLAALTKPIEEGDDWPRPRCPKCASGHIRFGRPAEDEDHASATSKDHVAWEPEWIHGTFSIRGECENPSCRLAAHGSGDFWVSYATRRYDSYWDEAQETYAKFYRLAHIHPAPQLMAMPEGTPALLQEGIRRASRVFLADPPFAATALRSVVEALLTDQGVPALTPNGKFLSADKRIREWEAAGPNREATARLLLAVKWIGNEGTHEVGNLSAEDVLEGASFLDEAFHRLYIGPDLDFRAQQINSLREDPPAS